MNEGKYASLPQISEEARKKIVEEVKDFAKLFGENPEQARVEVERDIEKIELVHNNKHLALAVRTAVDAAMDMVSGRLTHEEWMNLQLFLLKGELLVLQLLSTTLGEGESRESR